MKYEIDFEYLGKEQWSTVNRVFQSIQDMMLVISALFDSGALAVRIRKVTDDHA